MEQLFFLLEAKVYGGAEQNVSKKGYSSTFVQIVSKQKSCIVFQLKVSLILPEQ